MRGVAEVCSSMTAAREGVALGAVEGSIEVREGAVLATRSGVPWMRTGLRCVIPTRGAGALCEADSARAAAALLFVLCVCVDARVATVDVGRGWLLTAIFSSAERVFFPNMCM